MTYSESLLAFTAITTGLIAGLFYSWTCGITQGLGNLPDTGYLGAFQAINREIQRPWFFISFLGTVLLLPVSAWLCYRGHQQTSFLFLLNASLLYIIGVFGVTIAGNVPLNEMLDKTNLQSISVESIAEIRKSFESKWNQLNTVRTLCAIASLAGTIIACIKYKS